VPWFAARTLSEVRTILDGTGVLWGPYQDFSQLVSEDERCSLKNPKFGEIEQEGIGRMLVPKSPLAFSRNSVPGALQAPLIGQNTLDSLKQILKLDESEIALLIEKKIL
jgi:2-methylfumaryl-CoA isomerase